MLFESADMRNDWHFLRLPTIASRHPLTKAWLGPCQASVMEFFSRKQWMLEANTPD